MNKLIGWNASYKSVVKLQASEAFRAKVREFSGKREFLLTKIK